MDNTGGGGVPPLLGMDKKITKQELAEMVVYLSRKYEKNMDYMPLEVCGMLTRIKKEYNIYPDGTCVPYGIEEYEWRESDEHVAL